MLRFALTALSITLAAGSAHSDGYTAPEGCELIATMRMSECVVEHVSRCTGGNVSEQFRDGQYLGRAVYGHPSLFIRYEAANGYIIGHAYGEGTPELGKTLQKGETYTYERQVFRNQGDREEGDCRPLCSPGKDVGRLGSESGLGDSTSKGGTHPCIGVGPLHENYQHQKQTGEDQDESKE